MLRHAAESEAIAGNPLALVRAPKRAHRDEVHPLTPDQVEQIRAHLDARERVIVSLLAYAGIRPGELRVLQWGEVRQRTLLVQAAGQPDGTRKSVKGSRKARTVRLLQALADDLADYRAEIRPTTTQEIAPRPGTGAWSTDQWNDWVKDRWRPACVAASWEKPPRPNDLRHSFASLLLAEGRTVHDVATQLGHAAEMTLRVYGHVIDGLDQGERPNADREIAAARAKHPADARPVGARATRGELDDHLRQQLLTEPPGSTSRHHAQVLADTAGLNANSAAVTKGMKRLVARGLARQGHGINPASQTAATWWPA